jgi:hypothetical protein
MTSIEESSNETRAMNIACLLHMSDYELGREGLVDLITDGLHYAAVYEFDPRKVLETATDHFEDERGNLLSTWFPNENDSQFFTVILTVSDHLVDVCDSPAWVWEGFAEDKSKAISQARKAASEAYFTDDPDDFAVHSVAVGKLEFLDLPDEYENESSSE